MLIKKQFVRLTYLLVVSLMGVSSVLQAFSLPDLQQKLATQQLVRGQYIQSKNMQMFKQPLRSEGDFLLDQQHGLLWLQRQPFPVSIVLTKDKLSQQFAEQPVQIIEVSDNPMVFYFSHLFLSLFKGDVQALTTQFEMQLQGNSDQWLLLLTPKEAPLNNVFKEISVSGGNYINQLKLTELNADNTLIEFINQNQIPNKITDDEQHYFQF